MSILSYQVINCVVNCMLKIRKSGQSSVRGHLKLVLFIEICISDYPSYINDSSNLREIPTNHTEHERLRLASTSFMLHQRGYNFSLDC